MHRLSLQFLKISLQIANCREEPRGDRFASHCILSHAVRSLRAVPGSVGESATVVSPICATADLRLTTLIETHGEAQEVAPEILAQDAGLGGPSLCFMLPPKPRVAHALGAGEGCAATASYPAVWNDHHHANSFRTTPLLCADIIFGKEHPMTRARAHEQLTFMSSRAPVAMYLRWCAPIPAAVGIS
jgi:hypothetical protein